MFVLNLMQNLDGKCLLKKIKTFKILIKNNDCKKSKFGKKKKLLKYSKTLSHYAI